MSKRSDKYKNNNAYAVEKAVNISDLDTSTISSFDQDVYHRTEFTIKYLDNLLQFSTYSLLCVTTRVEASVGKGFNTIDDEEKNLEATDEWIVENIDPEEISKAKTDLLKYGECYYEVPCYSNKVLTLYGLPTSTMTIGRKGKYKNKFIQYYGSKDDIIKPIVFDKFDFDAYKLGKHPDGNFIIHIKKGNKVYGTPEWLPAKPLMQTIKEQNRTILSHFLNDADPDGITSYHNTDIVNNEDAKKFKANLENNFQGSEKRGKRRDVFNPLPKSETGELVSFLEIPKTIISKENLNIAMRNDFNVIALFRVPHFAIGFETTSKLGSGNQADTILQFWIANVVQPDQRIEINLFAKLFPGMKVQFNTMTLPKTNNVSNDNIGINTNEVNKAVEMKIKKAVNDNYILTKYEDIYEETL